MTVPWLVRDRHGQRRIAGGVLAPLLPTFLAMGKTKLGHDLAGGIEDDGVMVLFRPVDGGEVGNGGFRGHGDFPLGGSGGFWRSGCLGLRYNRKLWMRW